LPLLGVFSSECSELPRAVFLQDSFKCGQSVYYGETEHILKPFHGPNGLEGQLAIADSDVVLIA